MALTGICLLYMGGPSDLDAVKPFLSALFSDRELIQLPGGPLSGLLAKLIVTFRAPRVLRHYQEIGGGSPLLETTLEQARPALERLRRAIAEVSFEDSRGEPLRLTASVGAAQAAPAEDPVALLERVSERLLAAKGAGRDRVCV